MMLRVLLMMTGLLASSTPALAQQQIDSRVDVSWNRFYDFDAMTKILEKLVAEYPELLSLHEIGRSVQGRPMWLVILNNDATGPDISKPAMWVDGNVHGNEIQATETVLYTIWYLASAYGQVPRITELVDRTTWYFVPTVNPDGRDDWFKQAHTSHSNRTGLRPTDNDRDGLFDEDPPEDLNGDGSIGRMWKRDPKGNYVRNEDDPRIFEYVDPVPGPDGRIPRGEWTSLGAEGIDNDGDGRINEDGLGGYDMNRNWPSDWHPQHVQNGAGTHPFSFPETRSVGEFIHAHPNIAAGQSYHNAGGMILRGPGASYRERDYPGEDVWTYEAIQDAGEEMLPFYRKMVIHSDLYTVHGGFVNWLAEGLGVVSFTNELWSDKRILQSGENTDEEGRLRFEDRVLFGQTFNEYTEFDHPDHGPVLIGGGSKWWSRTPPPFMLEEEAHRNFAFTVFHAEQMPELQFSDVEVTQLSDGLWQVDATVVNDRLISSRTGRAARRKIGMPDFVTFHPDEGFEVIAGGTVENQRKETKMTAVEKRPNRMANERGVTGRMPRVFRWIVSGTNAPTGTITYESEKARDIQTALPGDSG
jgi:hypothetical protein